MLWPGNCSIWNSSSYLRTRRSIPDLAFPGDRKSLEVDSDCVQIRTDSRTPTRVNSVRSQQSSHRVYHHLSRFEIELSPSAQILRLLFWFNYHGISAGK